MILIHISNYRKKFFWLLAIVVIWVGVYLLSDLLVNQNLILRITVDRYITFSYPVSFSIDDVLTSYRPDWVFIETNSSSGKPLIREFSEYNSIEGNFGFNYPSTFILQKQEFQGNDILYHIDFHDRKQPVHGFVQVWNLPGSLKEFLESSKSSSQLNFLSFDSKPININGMDGYVWDYTFMGSDGQVYKGVEDFLRKDKKMYRVSMFMPENLWDKNYEEIFNSMVKSLKIKS